MAVLPTYRNQSIDLHRKSIDWFLYEGNTDNKWVKKTREVNGNKFQPPDRANALHAEGCSYI